VTTIFSKEGGWPYGDTKDTDTDIFEKEKKIVGSNPVHDVSHRQLNTLVLDTMSNMFQSDKRHDC
jgi:hypothetical protein